MQSFTARMPLLTANSTSGLGRRRWSGPQQCYLHCLCTINKLAQIHLEIITKCSEHVMGLTLKAKVQKFVQNKHQYKNITGKAQ